MPRRVHLSRSTRFTFRSAGLVFLAAVVVTAAVVRPGVSATRADDWPRVELPAGAESFSIGEQMSINGVPMRLQGFTAQQDMASTIAWFKAKLGQSLVEDRLGNKTVLGHPSGDHYVTVQIEPVLSGVQGIVGVSDMRLALSQREQSRAAHDAWVRDLPADTKILNLMASQDAEKASIYLVASNQQSDSLNAERATSALEKRGFVVQRTSQLDKGSEVNGSLVKMSGKTVLFKSAAREATLLTFHDESGKAAIVINTVVSKGAP